MPCICRLELVMSKIDPTHVEVIRLDNNNLEELPPSLEKFINLKELDLSDNKLQNIPKYLDNFRYLSNFKIEGNQLKSSKDSPA
jgi:Leucine-rich repeat (LRR) protein